MLKMSLEENVKNIRDDFPIFSEHSNLIYLDTAASAQKPRVVLEAMDNFYKKNYSNVHRGVHHLSVKATDEYERARSVVADFIGANLTHEIIFTRGTTESLNLLAQSFVKSCMQPGDRILLSQAEHHSNIVPWQLMKDRFGIEIDVCPIDLNTGLLDLIKLESLLTDRTKLVSITHISNVLGVVNPVEQIIQRAHAKNIPVCLDAAQSIGHRSIDVKKLDCDFLVFSGHKLYGPTGIGVLYGKEKYLRNLTPAFGGGSMIETVSFEKTIYAKSPMKFEPGTPPVAEAIGLAAAMIYIKNLGWDWIVKHESNLTSQLLELLGARPEISFYPKNKNKNNLNINNLNINTGVVSFNLGDIHAHDVGSILDSENIAIRAGHHCAMPLMNFYQVPAMGRISLGIYNQIDELEKLKLGLLKVKNIFKD